MGVIPSGFLVTKEANKDRLRKTLVGLFYILFNGDAFSIIAAVAMLVREKDMEQVAETISSAAAASAAAAASSGS